jgi:hypothetical protein
MSALTQTVGEVPRRASVPRPLADGRSRRAGGGTETELVRALLREAREVERRRARTVTRRAAAPA